MIQIKAIKQSQQEAKPAREDYVHDETEKGRFIPLAFLLFLTGFAVYLTSFLPVRPEAAPEPHDDRHRDDEGDQGITPSAEGPGAGVEDDVPETLDRVTKSSGNVVAFPLLLGPWPQAVGSVLASGSPPLVFKGPGSSSPGDQGRAINDNQSAGGDNSGASSSGGGGGGGGRTGNGGGGSSDSGSGGSNPKPPGGSNPDPSRNRAPRTNGPVHLSDLVGCHAYPISVLALLAGATDPDGDRLRVVGLSASSGTVTPTQDGGWLFTPERGMLGDVTLTYFISDGTQTIQQVAHFRIVEAPPIVGTGAADNLLGTHCADVIDGGHGDDNIDARDGNDVVMGGDGDDHIVGGAGGDVIDAGSGDDIVFAGTGKDIVFGGPGNDRLFGEDGDDTIYGDQGDDLIIGGAGADVLLGGSGSDTLHGDDGRDVVDGGDGSDILHGGAGQDVMLGSAGNDTVLGDGGDDVLSDGDGADAVHGGDGNDYVAAAADAASDSYSGDAGEDTLDYSAAVLDIVVDLGDGTAEGLEIGKDLISGFEKIIGGGGHDHITAGSTSIAMTGGGGCDTFEFDRPDDDHHPNVIWKITDFTIGDRIKAAIYDIHHHQDEDGDDAVDDLFDAIYLSDDDDHRPVRFRFEKFGDDDRTFIDIYDSDDSEGCYSIELSGHHHLAVTTGVP